MCPQGDGLGSVVCPPGRLAEGYGVSPGDVGLGTGVSPGLGAATCPLGCWDKVCVVSSGSTRNCYGISMGAWGIARVLLGLCGSVC